MAGLTNKKRRIDSKAKRPTKKQRRINAYKSDSESEDGQAFDAVNLLDSDDDIHNAQVDDVGDVDENGSSSSDEEAPALNKAKGKTAKSKEPEQEDDDAEESESDLGDDDMDLDDLNDKKTKSKRSDPTAFANSLSKILSTKLSTSKRSDPVLARSAAAHASSKAAVDNALEAKARRKLKEQKRTASEKGRVKDILEPATNESTGEPEISTATILDTERKLRKIAQRGVVRLFNAVRTAQVKAAEAEKGVRKDGVIGVKNREERVNELSKKGFLELIASGGGGLKKGPLEEA